MITYITWLRCLAAILITNAHYTGIYPIEMLANGGLIGDIVFFAISGFCLTNIRYNFIKWYTKRLCRILPPVLLITLFFTILGNYNPTYLVSGTENTIFYNILLGFDIKYSAIFSWFIYPTYYHFVGSILILYIPYYFVMKNEWLKGHIQYVMIIIFIVYMLIYLLIYDKSYYHIDTVREPMIRFLFFESMLLGAYFRIADNKIRDSGSALKYSFGVIISFSLYFVSKILFSKGVFPQAQAINQFLIFVLLYFLLRWFSSIDYYLKNQSKKLNNIVKFIAGLTLEIYLVQYVMIDKIRSLGLLFPLNWFTITVVIIFSAYLLQKFVDIIKNIFMKEE